MPGMSMMVISLPTERANCIAAGIDPLLSEVLLLVELCKEARGGNPNST
jgi:hypothetical protein